MSISRNYDHSSSLVFIDGQEDSETDSLRYDSATKIQALFRGHLIRKVSQPHSSSEGQEIEIYIPLLDSDSNSNLLYGDLLYKSPCFTLVVEKAPFSTGKQAENRVMFVIEIVTEPYCRGHPTCFKSKHTIDSSVRGFMNQLEHAFKQLSGESCLFYPLGNLVEEYNQNYPENTLVAQRKTGLGLFYTPGLQPTFGYDKREPSRPAACSSHEDAKSVIVNVQLTFCLSIEKYRENYLTQNIYCTNQQGTRIKTAEDIAAGVLGLSPLPANTNQHKIMGLLVNCAEKAGIISELNKKTFTSDWELLDMPILMGRFSLHYVKGCLCNKEEIQWFDKLWTENQRDLYSLFFSKLNKSAALPKDYGQASLRKADNSQKLVFYDPLQDLFKPNSMPQGGPQIGTLAKMSSNASTQQTWKETHAAYRNVLAKGRTLLPLQKVCNPAIPYTYELQPLFEARKIGYTTIKDYQTCNTTPQGMTDSVTASTETDDAWTKRLQKAQNIPDLQKKLQQLRSINQDALLDKDLDELIVSKTEEALFQAEEEISKVGKELRDG